MSRKLHFKLSWLKAFMLLFCWSFSSFVLAEGTKQVWETGSTADRCVLPIYVGTPVSRFATYLASPDQRLYIHIKTAGERVYLGFQEETGDFDAVYFRIKDPLGNILGGTPMAVPTSGAGYISTYAQAVAGPNTISAGGYSPVMFTASMAGDYWIEFNQNYSNSIDTTTENFAWNNAPDQIGRELTYWDITVATPGPAAPVAEPGRIWSKEFAFLARTGAAQANPFVGPLYIYTEPDKVINKADFNGMKPLFFYIHSNPTGCSNTGNVAVDRQSRISKTSYSKYKVFLNTPDAAEYPPGVSPSIVGTPTIEGCSATNYKFTVNTTDVGEIEVILDLNGVAGYQSGTSDVQILSVASAGNNVINWNGLNGLGAAVAGGTNVPVIINYKGGIAHFPLWDAEQNPSGFKLSKIAPAGGTTRVYYDDSQIPLGTSDVNTGVLGGTAAHAWTTTASDNPSAGQGFGNNRTINTWMVTYFSTQNIAYTMAPNCPVYTVASGKCISNYINGESLATVADADGAISVATLVSGSLPPGTALNGVNGQITVSNTAALVAGIYTFSIKTTDARGGVSTTPVTITFYANPTSNAGTDQNLCNTSSATFAASGVGSGTWTLVSGAGTFVNANSPTSVVNGLQAGPNTFRWTTTNGGCTAFDDVTINSSVTPVASNAGADQGTCNSFNGTLTGNSPAAGLGTGTGTWTKVSGPGNVTFGNVNLGTSTITVDAYGTYVLRWTIANYCGTTSDDITFNFYQTPTASVAGASQNICGTVATLSGNVPAIGSGTWSKISGPGTVTFSNPNAANSDATVSAYGTYDLQWSISNGTCAPSNSTVTINYFQNPTAANAGSDQSVCGLATVLAGNIPAVGSGTWTKVSGPGTVTFSNVNLASSNASVSAYGTYVLKWSIANGNCAASADNVTVNYYQTPTASNAGSDQDVCGFGATLTGNAPAIGTGTWSKISGPGAIVFGNANSATSTATASSYGTYVLQWSISNGTCAASTSSVSITYEQSPDVSNAGPDQSICDTYTINLAANAPVIGTGVWTQVSGPAGAVFANANSPTSNVSGLSTGTFVFRWSITNGVCPVSFDDITVLVSTTPSFADAGADQNLCAVTSTTFQGNTPASGIGTWTKVSGPAGETITSPNNPNSTVNGLSTGTYIFKWDINNGACASAQDQVQIVVSITPITTSDAGPDQDLCAVASATMAANTPVSGTGTWTKVSGPAGETILFPNNPTTDITGLTPGTYVFRWTITNGGCTPSFDDVTVVISANPTASAAGSDASVCVSSTTLAANNPGIGSGVWTLVSGTGTITSPTSFNSSVTGLGTGINTFRWTISNGACLSSSDDVDITHDALPTTASAGVDYNTCDPDVTLSGNTPVIGSGTWTLVAGSGSITNPADPLSGVTGLGFGANTFRWTISNGSCTASSDDIIITRDVPPTPANAGADFNICASSSNFAANTPVTGVGTWTLISGSGTITNVNDPNSPVTGLSIGANTFAWNISNGVCASSSDNIVITRDDLPTASNAGSDISTCSLIANLAGNAPTTGIGTWTQTGGPGVITFSNSNSATSNATASVFGTYVLQWSIVNGSCGSSTSTVNVNYFDAPTTANAGSNQDICGLAATLSGNAAVVGTGTWSQVSGPGTITFSNINDPASDATASTYGTYVLQWSISNGSCAPSVSTVTINYFQSPSASVAGSDQDVCGLVTSLNGNNPAVGNGVWTLVSGPGTISFSNANSETSSATASVYGTYVLQWTISNGNCASTSSQVTINYFESPTASNAGVNQDVCGLTTNLAGNTPLIGTGTWTKVSGPGTVTFGNPSLETSSATVTVYGTYVLQWSISNGNCPPSTSTVTINYFETPTTASAGADQSWCNTFNVTLGANSPAVGTGIWTETGGPAAVITDPSDPNTTVTGMVKGTYTFLWTITNGSCNPSSDEVTILISTTPSTADAGPDQSQCNVTSATLAGNNPASGFGTWTKISGPAGSVIDAPNDPNSTVSSLGTGTYVFRWTINNGMCPGSFDDVTIVTSDTPISISNAGSDQSFCASSSTTMAANAPASGIGTWTQVSGPAGAVITNINDPLTTITNLSTGTYVFEWTITNGGCTPSTDQVTIINSANPSASLAGPDFNVCGTSTNLTGNTPADGTGIWTLISGAATIVSPNSPTSAVTGLGIGPNVFRWTISNGTCASTSDDITITGNVAPTTSDAGSDFNICSAVALLSGNNPVNGTGTWTLRAGAGTITDVTDPNSGITGLGIGPNTFRWTISNGSCTASFDEVTITRNAPPTVANAGADFSICSANGNLSGNMALIGTGTWTLVSGAGIIASPNSANSTVSGLSVGPNVFKWTISNGACAPSSDNVTITRDAVNVPNAGPDQSLCANNTVFAGNSAGSGTGTWTLVSGTGTITAPNNPNSAVNNLGAGDNTFQWSITNGTCPAQSDMVVIHRDLMPDASIAGSDQNICADNTTMTANNPAVGTGTWSVVSGNGVFVNPNSPTTSVTGLPAGANVFKWTIANGTCGSNSSNVTITRIPAPTIADAGTDQNICSTTATMAANTAAVGVGSWSLKSGSGIITNPSSPSSNITNLGVGNNVFTWTITNGVCPPTQDDIVIKRDSMPSIAKAGSDQSFCNTFSTMLGATAPTVGTGNWSIALGNGVFDNLSAANATVSGLASGKNLVKWTITNGSCPSNSDTVEVFVNNCVLGLAKTASASKAQPNGNYNVTYTLFLKNMGDVKLVNVKLEDVLSDVFPSPSSFTLVNTPTATGTLVVNSGYDGRSNSNLLTNASYLEKGASASVSFTLSVKIGSSGTFKNSAKATGYHSSGIGNYSDISDNGSNPDENNNNNPSDPDESDPTPITMETVGIFIPEGFSPNGDGENDVFQISFAEQVSVELTVFNRWGNKVFEDKDYKNNWSGNCNTGLHFGEVLPDGTYYVIVKMSGQNPIVKYITLKR